MSITERDSTLMWALAADRVPLWVIAEKFEITKQQARQAIYREDSRLNGRKRKKGIG